MRTPKVPPTRAGGGARTQLWSDWATCAATPLRPPLNPTSLAGAPPACLAMPRQASPCAAETSVCRAAPGGVTGQHDGCRVSRSSHFGCAVGGGAGEAAMRRRIQLSQNSVCGGVEPTRSDRRPVRTSPGGRGAGGQPEHCNPPSRHWLSGGGVRSRGRGRAGEEATLLCPHTRAWAGRWRARRLVHPTPPTAPDRPVSTGLSEWCCSHEEE